MKSEYVPASALDKGKDIMAASHLAPVYEYFLDFLVEKATPQEILAFEIPELERQRAIVLLEKQDDGTLTSEEVMELEQMQRTDRLISALKAKALVASSKK
jgi:hypothetical protein